MVSFLYHNAHRNLIFSGTQVWNHIALSLRVAAIAGSPHREGFAPQFKGIIHMLSVPRASGPSPFPTFHSNLCTPESKYMTQCKSDHAWASISWLMALLYNLDSGIHLLFNSVATSSSSMTQTCPGTHFPYWPSFEWVLPMTNSYNHGPSFTNLLLDTQFVSSIALDIGIH